MAVFHLQQIWSANSALPCAHSLLLKSMHNRAQRGPPTKTIAVEVGLIELLGLKKALVNKDPLRARRTFRRSDNPSFFWIHILHDISSAVTNIKHRSFSISTTSAVWISFPFRSNLIFRHSEIVACRQGSWEAMAC